MTTIGVGQPPFLPRPTPTHLHQVSRQEQDCPGALIPTDQGPVGLLVGVWVGWGFAVFKEWLLDLGTLIDICILLCGWIAASYLPGSLMQPRLAQWFVLLFFFQDDSLLSSP